MCPVHDNQQNSRNFRATRLQCQVDDSRVERQAIAKTEPWHYFDSSSRLCEGQKVARYRNTMITCVCQAASHVGTQMKGSVFIRERHACTRVMRRGRRMCELHMPLSLLCQEGRRHGKPRPIHTAVDEHTYIASGRSGWSDARVQL